MMGSRCRELFERSGSSGLVSVRDGDVLVALGDDPPVPVQSVTKLVVALGVGNALATIGDPVDLARRPLGDLLSDIRGSGCQDVTLDQLLGHRSGLRPVPPLELEQSTDPVTLALASARVDYEMPGFMYNNAGPFIVAHAIELLTGRGIDTWLRETVFDPLGCDVAWMRDPQGRAMPHGGLIASARTLALVGDAARRGTLFLGPWVDHLVAAGASAYPQHAWVEQRITTATVAGWRASGIADQIIEAVGPIPDGMTVGALMRQAPEDALSTLGAAVSGAGLRIAESAVGPVIGWGHDGDGGQWLIICPERRAAMAHTRTAENYEVDPQFFPPQVVLDEFSET